MSRSASWASRRRSNKRISSKRRVLRLEHLEPRIALSGGDAVEVYNVPVVNVPQDDVSTAVYSDSLTEETPLSAAPVAPKDFNIAYCAALGIGDALSFRFDQPTEGMTWEVLENGLPIAVNTRYYNGLSEDTWETTINAKEFTFVNKQVQNPIILPSYYEYNLRANTAGNKYEVRLTNADGTITTFADYGRFIGTLTQTGTVTLLDYDMDVNYSEEGVTAVRAYEGEQVAALILDAGTKVTLDIADLGQRLEYTPTLDLKPAEFTVTTNRTGVVTTELSSVVDNHCTLTIDTAALAGNGGMVSVCIENTGATTTTAARYLGIVVKDRDGNVPTLSETLTIGAVNENNAPGQQFFRGDTVVYTEKEVQKEMANRVGFQQLDSQYIYLNGGPLTQPNGQPNDAAWRKSSGGYDGKKLIQSVRESMKFGALPTVVYYNIMCPNESQQVALDNIKNEPFLVGYFEDLKFTIQTIRSIANGATVAMVIEPDFLAYMMQSAKSGSTYADPSTIEAMTQAAYTAGLLPDPGASERLPNTLPGFVEAINRGMRYLATTTEGTTDVPFNLEYGWKFNLWAYEVPGVSSLMKATDSLGWEDGRTAIANAAQAVAAWYEKAGILTGEPGKTMNFIAIDKYGIDGGAYVSTEPNKYPQTKPGYTNPAEGNYFYNADHWNNYLLFAQTLHEKLEDLPVRLWQIPIGHVNASTYAVDGTQVPALPNVYQKWEDSAVDFFFGDTFTGKSDGRDPTTAVEFFTTDHAGTVVTYNEQTQLITWSNQLKAAADAGIEMIMFGPGLPDATQGGGYSSDPPYDNWFWASKVKDYYADGALFIESPSVVVSMAEGQSESTSNSEIHYTVVFSHAISGFTAQDVTINGTAGTIEGATISVESVIDGIEYDVTIALEGSANTGPGDIIASIGANEVQDKDGNNNLASNSTTVFYVPNTITGYGKSNPTQILGGGEPLPGVLVSLTSTAPGFAERLTTTDNDGYYEFENVPDGTYQVTVTCPGACLDTGADTTTVNASGSQSYETDFAFGALKPTCIPNRMMVATSYPIESVRWHQVVQEALNLGKDTSSQVSQVSTIETATPEVTKYLVLDTETVGLSTSNTMVADENNEEIVDNPPVHASSDLETTATTVVSSTDVSSDATVDELDEVDDPEVVDTSLVQSQVEPEQVVEVIVSPTIVSAETPIVVEEETDAPGTVVVQVENEPEETATAAVVTVEVSSYVIVAEQEAAASVDTVNVETDPRPAKDTQAVVVWTDMTSGITSSKSADTPVVKTAEPKPDSEVLSESEPKSITQAAVTPIVEEAIARWVAVGLNQQTLDAMLNTTFLVSDLDGIALGMARGNTVWLDVDAVGRGWFVDSTPHDDEEFQLSSADGPLQAVSSEALDRVDLFTVIAHELGHVAGLDDSDLDGVMGATLKTGMRCVPSAHDAVLANLY